MRAIRLEKQGGPEELKLVDLPDPVAGPGEAVVRLHAAGLNHRELFIRQGLYPRIKLPCVLGSDGAGVVESVGAGVDAKWIGKRAVVVPFEGWGADPKVQGKDFFILGMPRQGTLAERIAVPVSMIAELPAHLSFEEGACFGVAGITAYRAVVTRGELKSGEHVLITGIGGGVATIALLFAKALGAQVSVTSSSDEKLARARALGAVVAVSYKAKGWEKQLVGEAGSPPSLIIDGAVGDDFNALIAAAAPAARIVIYGATRGRPKDFDVQRLFFKQLDVRGSTMGNDAEFHAMLALIDRARIKPVIDRVFPLAQVAEADKLLESGAQFGKIVVSCV